MISRQTELNTANRSISDSLAVPGISCFTPQEFDGIRLGERILKKYKEQGGDLGKVTFLVDHSPTMRFWETQAGAWHDLLCDLYISDQESLGIVFDMDSNTLIENVISDERNGPICILTDCVGPKWRNGDMLKYLREQNSGRDVVILQMLPEDEWPRTTLREDISTLNDVSIPVSNDRDGGGRVYVIPFSGESFPIFADFLCGKYREQVRVLETFTPLSNTLEIKPRKNELSSEEVNDRFRRFMETAGSGSLDLARTLAFLPLTIESMELVVAASGLKYTDRQLRRAGKYLGLSTKRKNMISSSRAEHSCLAEIANAGVIGRCRTEQDDNWYLGQPNSKIVYDFLWSDKDGCFDIRRWLANQRSRLKAVLSLTGIKEMAKRDRGRYADIIEYVDLALDKHIKIDRLHQYVDEHPFYYRSLMTARARLGLDVYEWGKYRL